MHGLMATVACILALISSHELHMAKHELHMVKHGICENQTNCVQCMFVLCRCAKIVGSIDGVLHGGRLLVTNTVASTAYSTTGITE